MKPILLVLLLTASAATLSAQQTPAPTPASAAEKRSAEAQKDVGRRFGGSWGEKLREGGTTALVQLALSIFGAGFVFERLVNLRRKNIAPAGLADEARRLWRAGDFAALERFGESHPSTLGRVIGFIARHRDSAISDVSIIAGDLVSREMAGHYQRSYPLGIIATLEPLLGLLGMILGMIETFEIVALAGALGDPSQLAGGISEALVTTGLGLAIAIPFLALYHFFKSRTASYTNLLEQEVTDLLSDWLLRRDARPVEAGHAR